MIDHRQNHLDILKNSSGATMETSKTPALTSAQEEVCLLNITSCFLFF